MVRPFVLELVDAAKGEKVNHFRTVHHNGTEVKIFFTDSRIIMAKFTGGEFDKIESRLRGNRESLLGFEAMAAESIRKMSNDPLLPKCH